MSTRGIRNNNPANIRKGSHWNGMVKNQTDTQFCQFVSMSWGVRALLITLRTYVTKYNLHTVREIISRWAPPSDGNDTEKYIEFVEKEVNHFESPIEINLYEYCFQARWQHSKSILFLIARAMCRIESGYDLKYDIYLQAFNLM